MVVGGGQKRINERRVTPFPNDGDRRRSKEKEKYRTVFVYPTTTVTRDGFARRTRPRRCRLVKPTPGPRLLYEKQRRR